MQQPDYSGMYPYSFDVPQPSYQPASPLPPQDPYNTARLAVQDEASKQAYFQSLMDTQVPYHQPGPMPGLSKQQGWIAGGLGLISALSGPNGNAPGVVGNYVKQQVGRNTDQWQRALDAQKEQRQAEVDRRKLKAQIAQLDYEDKAREHGQAVTFKHQDIEKEKDRNFQTEKARIAAQGKTEAARLVAAGKPWAIVQQAMDAKYGMGAWGEDQLLQNPGFIMTATGRNVNAPALTAANKDRVTKATARAEALQPLLVEAARLKNWNMEAVASTNWEKYTHFDDELALKLAMFDLRVKEVGHKWSKEDADQWWKENGAEMQDTVNETEQAVPKAKAQWEKARIDLAAVKARISAIEKAGTSKKGVFDPKSLSESNEIAYESAKAELASKQSEVERLADEYLSVQNDYAERKRQLAEVRGRRPSVSSPTLPAVTRTNHPPIKGGIPKPTGKTIDSKHVAPPFDMGPYLGSGNVTRDKKLQSAADALDRLGL